MAKRILIVLTAVITIYIVYLTATVSFVYYIFKKHAQEITILRLAEYDSELGYHLKPNSHSVFRYPDGNKKCDVFTGGNSLRRGAKDDTINNGQAMLFLGCSFTFGDLCAYEDTWPYLVAGSTNSKLINAGVGGYGFGQMLISCEKKIGAYKPAILVFENTDWLIERSQSPFMSVYPFTISVPYFAKSGDSIRLVKPLHKNPVLSLLNSNTFYETPASIRDYLAFLRLVAPVILGDDVFKITYLFEKITGQIPTPEKDKAKIAQFVFNQVGSLCRQSKAQLIFMGVNSQSYKPGFAVKYVDAEKYLTQNLDAGTDYSKAYAHWYGNPPVCFDKHPNELAHKRMAEALLKQIMN